MLRAKRTNTELFILSPNFVKNIDMCVYMYVVCVCVCIYYMYYWKSIPMVNSDVVGLWFAFKISYH